MVGVQIDANRIICEYEINNSIRPFTENDVSIIKTTILGIGDFTSNTTIDVVVGGYIRFSIAHSGTPNTAYICNIDFKITNN